jgi:hypothetical protein
VEILKNPKKSPKHTPPPHFRLYVQSRSDCRARFCATRARTPRKIARIQNI